MADDGTAGSTLVTPSAIIKKGDGDLLKTQLSHGAVSLSITFTLPSSDGRVVWDVSALYHVVVLCCVCVVY